MNLEQCLPYDSKLENYFEFDMQIFEESVELKRAEHAGNDILDSDIEFENYETILHFHPLAQDMMGTFIDERNVSEDSHETRDAVYRAMMFAYQIAVQIHDTNTGFNASSYLAGLMIHAEDHQHQFECDVHDYLGNNPHVDAFISRFADDIDEGRNQLPAIELAAGMIFMLVERRLGELFINSQAATLSPQDFDLH